MGKKLGSCKGKEFGPVAKKTSSSMLGRSEGETLLAAERMERP
jgi:hypothetical protein